MIDYKQCKEILEKELEKLNLVTSPVELYEPIEYALKIGGKRIRPALVMLSTNMFDEDYQKSIPAALAVEIFHNFTLLHDDIMDNSVIRRNHPTVHVKWDNNVAILSGDAMMTKSYQILCTGHANYTASLLQEFNKAALEVCEGQMFDMNFEKRLDVSVADYINMIRLKTSVLIACALKMGAILGDADIENQERMYNFGLHMGIGFQLQDDLLDSFGDSASFGKKIGGDIESNKKTFLLLTALSEAKGEEYNELKKLVTTYEYSREEKVEKVLNIYNKFDIKKRTEQKIKEYFDMAYEYLQAVEVADERKVAMLETVEMLIHRSI